MQNELQACLISNLSSITQNIEYHFLKTRKVSVNDDRFITFHDILLSKLEPAIKKYQLPPEYDEKFDMVIDFTSKFIASRYYTGAECDAYAIYRKHIVEVPFITEQERRDGRQGIYIGNEIERINRDLEESSMEEKAEKLYDQERTEKAYHQFESMLTTFELYVFAEMKKQKGSSIVKIVEVLQSHGYKDATVDTITPKRKNLEYRLLCFFAIRKNAIHTLEVVLKGMNLFPSHNKQFFGCKKLLAIPADSELMKVASGAYKNEMKYEVEFDRDSLTMLAKRYDKDVKLISGIKKYVFTSKVDFNGKSHDHPVVYISKYGTAYDHVTEVARKLYIE